MAHNLSILEWNICSSNGKNFLLKSIVRAKNTDTVILQETLPIGTVHFSGYRVLCSPSQAGARGLMTLVKTTIPCSLIADLPYCGDAVESLAVESHLLGGSHNLYNVHSKPLYNRLDPNQAYSTAAQD